MARLEQQDELEEHAGAAIEPGGDPVEHLLEGLNEPQREAVTYGEGPLLVLAGAGSGKTRVLTHRVAYLLATGQARPNQILAITFTNKAAQEMRERVAGLVGGVEKRMWVMTFHAACARLLRMEAERLGYKKSFTIYDQADSLRMVKRCLADLEIDTKRYPPRSVQNRISDLKNMLVDAEAYVEDAVSPFESMVAQAYRSYERRMLEANAMDFDDLLMRAVNVLELFEDVRERYQERFRWILVDEYQDTNRAQYRLLQLLSGKHGNLTVVGDDSQAIYGFRGADVRNILEFESDFTDAAVIKLEQNYRSTQTILSAANAVIRNNPSNLDKSLWTDAGEGEKIVVAQLDDEHAEARYIAGEIEGLVTDEGLSRDDIAVFYRTNAMSRVLEDILVRYELPYQVIGGTKFYERAEIKDAIAYLQLLVNPADAVSFSRVINSPRRGIGDTSQGRLLAHANTTGQTIWEVALAPESVPGLGAAAIKSVGRFTELIEGLRADFEDSPVAELLEALLERSGYMDYLKAERTIEAEGRIENLEELVGVASEFDANRAVEGEVDLPPLDEFLQAISLYTDSDDLARRRGEGDADDAPQRQGPGVPSRLRPRMRGGRVPALPLAGGGERGRGAPPLLRGHHEGARAAAAHPRPRAPRLRRPLDRGGVALSGRAARGPRGARRHRPPGDDRLGEWRSGRPESAAYGRSGDLDRRRRRARELRQRRGDQRRAGRGPGRPLRERRLGAKADGRLRPDKKVA